MSTKIIITRDDLVERMKSNVSTNYMTLYSVMKSVTIALAGIVLTSFVANKAWEVDRFLFWIASFLATILTYNAVVIGSIVEYWMPSWKDVLFPFVLAVVEIMLFNILQVNPQVRDIRISAWYLVFSLFAFTASLILHNVVSKLDTENYAPDLKYIIKEYRRGQIKNQRKSFIIGAGSLVVFVVSRSINHWVNWEQESIYYGVKIRWIVAGTGIAACLCMIGALNDHETERKLIDRELVHHAKQQLSSLSSLPENKSYHRTPRLRAFHVVVVFFVWLLRPRRR